MLTFGIIVVIRTWGIQCSVPGAAYVFMNSRSVPFRICQTDEVVVVAAPLKWKRPQEVKSSN